MIMLQNMDDDDDFGDFGGFEVSYYNLNITKD